MRAQILENAWSDERKALTGAFGENHLDASLLLISELGLLPPSDERFVATCEAIGRELVRNGRIMRYAVPDDFGMPETAFLACEFWYMDALRQIGRNDEAHAMFEIVLAGRNHFGLLSEDIHPDTGALWGNLPQTYSMAGIINTATDSLRHGRTHGRAHRHSLEPGRGSRPSRGRRLLAAWRSR